MPTRGQMGIPHRQADWDAMQDLRNHKATEEYVAKKDSISVFSQRKPMRYLLNSAVITSPGTYDYRLVTPAQAKEWSSGGFRSTIGYEQTAEALAQILGSPVAVDRTMIQMQPGDEALVFRLALPPGTPRIDPGDKGRLSQAVMDGHFEIGILARTA